MTHHSNDIAYGSKEAHVNGAWGWARIGCLGLFRGVLPPQPNFLTLEFFLKHQQQEDQAISTGVWGSQSDPNYNIPKHLSQGKPKGTLNKCVGPYENANRIILINLLFSSYSFGIISLCQLSFIALDIKYIGYLCRPLPP